MVSIRLPVRLFPWESRNSQRCSESFRIATSACAPTLRVPVPSDRDRAFAGAIVAQETTSGMDKPRFRYLDRRNGRLRTIRPLDTVAAVRSVLMTVGRKPWAMAFWATSKEKFNADLLLPYGVTACVDAGTAGSANYEALHRILAQKQVRAYTFLNISPMGQMGSGLNENLDPALTDEAGIQRLIESYPGEIRGLKVRISRSIVGSYGSAPLKRALKLGARFGLPVCVHCTDPCIPMAEFAAMLRPGDILCHLYHGKGSTILDDSGKVLPEVLDAAARGVVMDCANGRTNPLPGWRTGFCT